MKKDLTQEEIPVWVVDDDEVRYSIRFALATHGIQTLRRTCSCCW